MDNPCFDGERAVGGKGLAVYTIEGGGGAALDNRRNERRSVRGNAPPPVPCLHKEWGGWSLDLAPGQTGRLASLAAALLLATLITIAATAALVYTLRSVHTNYQSEPVSADSWSAEMLVSGEFRVLNEPFKSIYLDPMSKPFRKLSQEITQQLESLFRHSLLWSDVKRATVTSLMPNLKVKCSLVLKAKDSLTVSNVGLAFLNGLNHTHGHCWLGRFIIDIQSISFSAMTEEVSWSQWSDWSECSVEDPRRPNVLFRKRKRVCLSLDGLKLNRPEPCLALPGAKREFEIEKCIIEESVQSEINKSLSNEPKMTTTIPETTTNNKTFVSYSDNIILHNTSIHITKEASSSTTSTTTTTESQPDDEQKFCDNCEYNEVCIALENEPVPTCRPIKDPMDPTGCGGWCKLNLEICQYLAVTAHRCVDDSKCLDNEWQCGNKLCIPSVKRCDGHFNCYDHTDENDCECDLKTHFQCGKNLSCLPKSKRCDGIVDCWDAADESNCTIACLNSTQFTCNNSQCIPSKNFCDGYIDCNDHSDEPFGCGGLCKSHEWKCNNGRCIIKRDVCNGHDDCGDHSDERTCGKRRSGS
ncbi:uncharacterized protein LOC106673246 isoform X2 [Cimex lectularius]|nr:uncharacterized protein LOC106673246 isoform X2 [Cimex lectularius]